MTFFNFLVCFLFQTRRGTYLTRATSHDKQQTEVHPCPWGQAKTVLCCQNSLCGASVATLVAERSSSTKIRVRDGWTCRKTSYESGSIVARKRQRFSVLRIKKKKLHH